MSEVTLEYFPWNVIPFTLEETEINDPWIGLDLSGGDEASEVPFSYDEPLLWNSGSQLVNIENSTINEMSFNMAQSFEYFDKVMVNNMQPESYPRLKEQNHYQLASTDQSSQSVHAPIFTEFQIPEILSSPSDSMPSLSDTSDHFTCPSSSTQGLEPASLSTLLASSSSSIKLTSIEHVGAHASPRIMPRKVGTGYICHVCRAGFETKRKLSTHQRQHSKPEKCPVCGKQTAEPRDLNRHIWADHEEYAIRFKVPSEARICPVLGCGMTGRKDNLPRHCLSKHGMKLRWRRGAAVLEEIDKLKVGEGA